MIDNRLFCNKSVLNVDCPEIWIEPIWFFTKWTVYKQLKDVIPTSPNQTLLTLNLILLWKNHDAKIQPSNVFVKSFIYKTC